MKPYAEMTKDEARFYIGNVIIPNNNKNSYIVNVDENQFYSGYCVVSKERDPGNRWELEDIKNYIESCPEMLLPGWFVGYNKTQVELKEIREEWVKKSDNDLKALLYSIAKYKFINDNIWEGSDTSQYISKIYKGKSCDEISLLANQYNGDSPEKYQVAIEERNTVKNYIRVAVDKFLLEHKNSPEEVIVEKIYAQEKENNYNGK